MQAKQRHHAERDGVVESVRINPVVDHDFDSSRSTSRYHDLLPPSPTCSSSIIVTHAPHQYYDDYAPENGSYNDQEDLLEPYKEPSEANSSFWWVTFNLWNDILGAGSIGMPLYTKSIGVWLLFPLLIFFACITSYTLSSLYHLGKKYRQPNYPELCKYSLGKPGTFIVCVFMFMFNFGGYLASLLIAGTIAPSLLKASFGESHLFERKYVLICICIVFLPISFFRQISHYAVTSLLSCSSLLFVGIILVVRAGFESQPPQDSSRAFNWIGDDFLPAVGGLSYLFVCHDMAYSVFESYTGSTHAAWRKVIAIVMLATIAVFSVIGYSGYFLFYDQVESNILDNFDATDVLAIICRVFLAINIMLSVPYNVFMPRLALYSLWKLFFGKSPKGTLVHVIMTSSIALLGLLISEFVTDLGTLFELVGAISGVGIAFILPPVIFLKLEPGVWYSPKKLINIFVLVFGLSVMGLSTGSIIKKKVNGQ